MKCKGEFCGGARVVREKGKGSFAGWALWICRHCGQVVKAVRVAE